MSNDEFTTHFETFGCPGSTWALFEVRIIDGEDLGLVDISLDSLQFWGP